MLTKQFEVQRQNSMVENNKRTAEGYICDTAEIVKASWSNFDHIGAAAFALSEISPGPPVWSAKDLPR